MLWLTEENTLDWLPCLQGRSFETDKVKLSFYKHNVVFLDQSALRKQNVFLNVSLQTEVFYQVFLKQLKTKRWSF